MSEITRQQLLDWDRAGFFPQAGETPADFASRVDAALARRAELIARLHRGETIEHLGYRIQGAQLIPEKIYGEAAGLTSQLFGFEHRGALGIFADVGGWLWGGCMISEPEEPLPLFILRPAFAQKRRWFCYRREELLAHELCHAVRQSLEDDDLEEYFAYRTSFSRFRRWCGDLFNSAGESVAFALLALAMPIAQTLKLFVSESLACIIPVTLVAFWGFLAYLAVRTARRHHLISTARRKLQNWGIVEAMPLLFRLTKSEITELCRTGSWADYRRIAAERSEKNLRWQVIWHRFF